jgi:hypothetical protein
MLLATPEQRTGRLFFPVCRAFLELFARQKARIERLETNSSEQLRLITAIEYNGNRSSQ